MILESLKISNFAIIDDVNIEFHKGANVITGETGAGKSIIIGALSMVLGEWVGKEIVKSGSDTCEVEAVFGGDINNDVKEFLIEKDLGYDNLILRRKFFVKGISKCYINDHHVVLNSLKELGNVLIDIHSQHEHQAILSKTNQMLILDRYADSSKESEAVRTNWNSYKNLIDKRNSKQESKDITEKEIERLNYEVSEIDSLELSDGVDEEIENDYKILSNAGFLHDGIKKLYSNLYENEGSIHEKIAGCIHEFEDLVEVDDRLKGIKENMDISLNNLESACENMRSYLDDTDFDTNRLEEVLKRRNLIMTLKRKYGDDISSIISYRDEIKEKIDEYVNFNEIIKKLDMEISKTENIVKKTAKTLSKKRKQASEELSKLIEEKLRFLGMHGAKFQIQLSKCEIGPNGSETVLFLVSTNPGHMIRELSKIASGGEISRVMLAVKSVFAQSDNIPILIFDEIDAGIGATISALVGAEIKSLSNYHQVIVITHLAKIAACSDNHIKVEKKISDTTTQTIIKTLNKTERLQEIARMVGGEFNYASEIQAKEILKKT